MQLRSWGKGPVSVFKLGEQSLSRRRRDNRGAVGAEAEGGGWGAGRGCPPPHQRRGFGRGHQTTGNTLTKCEKETLYETVILLDC